MSPPAGRNDYKIMVEQVGTSPGNRSQNRHKSSNEVSLHEESKHRIGKSSNNLMVAPYLDANASF